MSGSSDKTIKVWDSGAFWAPNGPSLAKTDACWLAWQLRWISRRRRSAPTALSSARSPSRPMARRLCPDPTTGRSKCGIRVRFGPRMAPPWPKLTLAGLPGSYAGSQDGEDQRPQRFHLLGRLLARWHEDCVRIQRPDDQSVGFGCVLGPEWPLLGQN